MRSNIAHISHRLNWPDLREQHAGRIIVQILSNTEMSPTTAAGVWGSGGDGGDEAHAVHFALKDLADVSLFWVKTI